jgi:uncharacterized protein (TIGR00251 family)
MKITVKAKPAAREDKIEEQEGGLFVVSVKEPPVKGRANLAIVKLLASYFSTSTDNVQIISGQTSRNKVVEITLPGE